MTIQQDHFGRFWDDSDPMNPADTGGIMAIHSVKDYYPEAKTWNMLCSNVIGPFVISIIEIETHDEAHFVDVFIVNKLNSEVESKRIIDLI